MATQPARKQQLVAALAGLLDDTQARSVQGRIREIYDDIMDLKKAGVKNKAIIERLNSQPEFLNNQLTSPVFAAYLGKIKLAKIREAKEAAGLIGITELARAAATSNTAQKTSGNKATTNANNSSAPPETAKLGKNTVTETAAFENNLNELESDKPTKHNENTNLSGAHRPAPLLNTQNGIWGKLKPSPVDGTVDLKQT